MGPSWPTGGSYDPEVATTPDRLSRSATLRERLLQVVPGGAHTYAKGDDQYPEHLAPLLTHGLGARVWDVDGNELRRVRQRPARGRARARAPRPSWTPCTSQLRHGSNFARPSELELQTAEEFLALVPSADMVKFAKNGSDATTAAVRLARAATGRDVIAVCADQPFFSTDDWFIGTTPMNAGIPQAVIELTDSLPLQRPRLGAGPVRDAAPARWPGSSWNRRRSAACPSRASSRACASCATPTARCWSSTR